jgi:LCP family protein required for cell wall assembly
MTFCTTMGDGYHNAPMAHGDKPYRVYRGGRAKGTVPLKRRMAASERRKAGQAASETERKRPFRLPRLGLGRAGWKRRILIGALVVLVLFVAWAGASYLAFRRGVGQANRRLDPAAASVLTPKHGLVLTSPTTILVLGTDHANTPDREGAQRSDSIMLLRTDPSRHRIVYLSIPRDLRVDVPGHGPDRINVAYQIGGADEAIRTVATYTDLPINHVIVVDFSEFERLIDALGGVDVNVPERILTNKFDCPYSAERCLSWQGYRFAKGRQHMNGRRALIYSRIRENRLDPSETDVTRGARQQQIVEAVLAKITSVGTMFKLPWLGDDLLRPMATDLSAGQLMQLGWVKLRAGHALHCRLGGDPQSVGGASEIIPVEENFDVIRMVEGTEPPRPPLAGSSLYAPGCSSGPMLGSK